MNVKTVYLVDFFSFVVSLFKRAITKDVIVALGYPALVELYAVEKPKSQVEQCSAVYFGRLSREKGLVDLLRAWSINILERT